MKSINLVPVSNVKQDIDDSLRLHRGLVGRCGDRVSLRRGQAHSARDPGTQQKGCDILPDMMDAAIPFIMLQHYVNPCAHYLSHFSSHVVALRAGPLTKGTNYFMLKG